MEISTIEELEGVTYEQLSEFLSDNGGFSKCEACGSQDWEITRISGGHILYLYQDVVFLENKTMVYLPVTCGTCMNTRFFNALGIAYSVLAGGQS